MPNLGKEIAAAGLNKAWLHGLAAVAGRVDDDIYILDLPRLIKCIEDDLETMARPVLETTPPTEEPHRRVQQRLDWLGALAPDRLSDEGFGGERHADHREKRERQHLDRRMAVDELADGLGRDQHHADRCDDGRHHHADLVHHADRGDDRVEREHDVDDGNLAVDAPEHGLLRRGRDHRRLAGPVLVTRLGLDEDFVRRLVQEKYSAEQQHDVSPADAVSHHGEEIGRQAYDPSER